jgi:uncharacterized membrane protein (UPF0136 family)
MLIFLTFSLIYIHICVGAWLFTMGLIGYIVFRSPVSLVLGVVPGFATVVLGFLSLRAWTKQKSNFIYILGQAGML